MSQNLQIFAPAKLNLHLRIFPKGADGFHPLRSWFRTVDVFDELRFVVGESEAAGELAGGRMSLWCYEVNDIDSHYDIREDDSNLVCRAWAAAAFAPRVDALLMKRIPTGGGLGGGSSDAAATLVAAGRVTERPVDQADLPRLAASLGSDVPFFLSHHLHGTTDAVCTGRGERVTPFVPARRLTPLLLFTRIACPTPAVYRRFDELPAPADDGTPDFAAWSALPAAELLPLLRNDLEPAAFSLRPDLAALRIEAERRLNRPVRMTGSGGTLFTLFDDADEAGRAAESLRDWPAVSAVVA